MEYTDPALTVSDQVLRLQQSGLIIHDIQRAERYLTYVGFHRLMKYAAPLRCPWSCEFAYGTSFDNLLDLYIFDRKLRLLVLDATERVEVAFRSVISNTMSLHGGPHWYLNSYLFSKDDNSSLMQDVAFATNFFSQKKQEGACKAYYTHYSKPALPTSWIATETLTFGKWSRVYQKIKDTRVQDSISQQFGLTRKLFESWLRSISTTRNYCAHHRRFWNRNHIVHMPKIPGFLRADLPHGCEDKTYARLGVIQFILKRIIHSNSFALNINKLIHDYPALPFEQHMGFPLNWSALGLWQ